MNANNAIESILRDAAGKQVCGRETLLRPKRARLSPEAAAILKEQWKSAGRDRAQIMMLMTEEDGSNPHLVTGWNGKDTFCCLTEKGLAYVDHRNLEKLKEHKDWNPKTRLMDVRAHQLIENEGAHNVDVNVDELVGRIKRTLKKSAKGRRKGRLRNMEKFFNVAVVESKTNSEKSMTSGPVSELDFEKIAEKDDRVPEAPKKPSTSKIPKGRSDESYNWDVTDKAGVPRRRGLRHPWMQENSTDPQMDKRELVDTDSEGKGDSGSATPGGNKTDAQQKLRQLVRMNREGGRFLESVRSDVGPNKQPGMGGAPHQGGHPVGSASYHHNDFMNRASSMRPGAGTPKGGAGGFGTATGRNSVLGGRPDEQRAKRKQLRSAGNRDAKDDLAKEMFRRSREGMGLVASTDPQLDRREIITVDKESGGSSGGATPGGNKTDPQKTIRQLVRMDRESGGGTVRSEEKLLGAKDSSDDPEDPDYTTYSGEKAKGTEFSSRPKITVRHEAMGSKKAQKLFGPGASKKSPDGAKKPLLMLVLMGKKAPMEEGEPSYTCPDCGHTTGNRMASSAGFIPKGSCPSPTCKRQRELSRNQPPKPPTPSNNFESRYGRAQLNLVEGKKKTPPAFLANIEKMKAKAKGHKADGADLDCR